MADSFAFLATTIPDWIQRLDSLVAQVEQRQRDLARAEEGEEAAAATTTTTTTTVVEERSARAPAPAEAAHAHRTHSMIMVYYDSYVQSFFEDLVRFVAASRNQLRKTKMTARVAEVHQSVAGMAANGGGGSDRGRGRNGPVPAVADNSRPHAAAADPDPDGMLVPPPLLNYKRTRAMRSPGVLATGRPLYRRTTAQPAATTPAPATAATPAPAAAAATSDVHDTLDRGLEAVQALCELAAHQFLRDGKGGDGVATIRQRLAETQAAAAAAAAAAAEKATVTEGVDGK